MLLYHGSTENFTELNYDYVYFSTCENFSNDYGTVKQFEIELGNIFNSLNPIHILQLIERVGKLYDDYEGIYYHNWNDCMNSPTYTSDTWETIEPHLKIIKMLGYDTVLITEGGIENYVTLKGNFKEV